MPRKRNKENNGVPKGWRFKNGAWRYRVPRGLEAQWDGKKEFKLGENLQLAYSVWSKRMGDAPKSSRTIGDLLQRYYVEVSSQKAPQTLAGDTRHYKSLLTVFNDVRIEDITPQDIYKYIDKRKAKIAARREKAMLSHAYTKAVEWGYIARHPFRDEVRLESEKPRTRYIENWEFEEIQAMKPLRKKGDPLQVFQAYIELKYLCGLRQGDMLRLPGYHGKVGDFLRIKTQKTGKQIDLEVTQALHDALTRCMSIRPRDIAPYLFCNRAGKPYFSAKDGTASGWQSNWHRFMKRVLAETKITERFTEHDIRAKTGSDSASKQQAQALLTHENIATTERAYRRKVEKVVPLR